MAMEPWTQSRTSRCSTPEWERRTFALALAMGATGGWSLDAFCFARENLPPDKDLACLAKNYYEARHL